MEDKWCKLFYELWDSMPSEDHVSATKRMRAEGLFKRISDMIAVSKHKDTMTNNIFAPTKAL